jgi:FkbM family methyltransferase
MKVKPRGLPYWGFHLWLVSMKRRLGKTSFLPSGFLELVDPVFLNDFGSFTLAGYNPAEVCEMRVSPEDAVMVLGGYLGDSSAYYLERFPSSTIHVFEPVPKFFDSLNQRFSSPRIKVHRQAASTSSKPLTLGVSEDSTGVNSSSGLKVVVESVDLSDFIDSMDANVGLMEINIEGGEYQLLNHLLETASKLPKVILVQFHQNVEFPEQERSACRTSLEKAGYTQRYSFDWIWERWDLDPNRRAAKTNS